MRIREGQIWGQVGCRTAPTGPAQQPESVLQAIELVCFFSGAQLPYQQDYQRSQFEVAWIASDVTLTSSTFPCITYAFGTETSGSLKRNVAPPPVRFSAHIRPPWASTIVRAMDKPIPMPFGFVVKNGSNTSFSLSC
jgi:hypothetical protein